MKKLRFSANISLYLRNNTRYGHRFYGMRIVNFIQAFEWYHFQWPGVTRNPDFKVTPVFDAEYLRNGNTIGTCTCPTKVSFRMNLSDLEWISEIFNDTKHRAVFLRQTSFLFTPSTYSQPEKTPANIFTLFWTKDPNFCPFTWYINTLCNTKIISRMSRATLDVVENWLKSFNVTQYHSNLHCWVGPV